MDRAGNQLLARPCFPEQQHRAVGGRDRLDGLEHASQGGTLADDLAELVAKLALQILLLVGQVRVEQANLLVGPRVLHGDGDLHRRLAEERDVILRECVRLRAADVQDPKLAVPRDERHATQGLEARGLHQRSSRRPERVQIRSTEDASHASLKRNPRGRTVQGERHVGPPAPCRSSYIE